MKGISAIWRYMPEEDNKTIKDISHEVKILSEKGYQAIQITAPYESAGFYPWWGLRPFNYFSINKHLNGTKKDFEELVKKCHTYNIKIIVFLNLGYMDVTAPFWKKACIDKREGRNSFESQCFLWSDNPNKKVEKDYETHFFQDGQWIWGEEARSYYWCHWKEGIYAEPQYNWENKECHLFVKSILEYWLSTGIDGVIVDAVNWYLNCDMKKIHKYLTDIVHKYPRVFCIPEGGTGFGDYADSWISDGGFDIIEDQTFHSDWNGSAILDALKKRDPELLDKRLEICNKMRKKNIVSWSYLCYGKEWTPWYRLIEIAVLIATGHMTEIIPSYLDYFEDYHKMIFEKIIRLAKYEQLKPLSTRTRIYPKEENQCYVLQCGDGENVIYFVFNFSDRGQKISLPVKKNHYYEEIEEKYIPATVNEVQITIAGEQFLCLVPCND